MFDAFAFLGESVPQASMLLNGYIKHLSKNPPADDDIRTALDWTRGLIERIVNEPRILQPGTETVSDQGDDVGHPDTVRDPDSDILDVDDYLPGPCDGNTWDRDSQPTTAIPVKEPA